MPIASALLVAALFDAHLVRWIVWVGLVVLTVALLLLIRTRWGQSQPLGKCVVLSLLAHLLLGIYTTTVHIVRATVSPPGSGGVQVALVDAPSDAPPSNDLSVPDSWNALGEGGGEVFGPPSLAAPAAAPEVPATATTELERTVVEAPLPLVPIARQETTSEDVGAPPTSQAESPIARSTPHQAEPLEEANAPPTEPDLVPPPETSVSEPQPGADTKNQKPAGEQSSSAPLATGTPGKPPGLKTLPDVMKKRVGNHLQGGRAFGATADSEAAVGAALKWMAANQRPSGRWEARLLGGGAGRAADGEDRQSAGMQADTGLTGLALLAFLAGGHTHLQGTYQVQVRRGLEYLLSVQDADGCLGGTGNRYERMYCHAMATCALSEAFAMTRDQRLQSGVRRAIGYTLRAQDQATGGWRYMPADPGDTSQLGWQLMALKSAELGGIPIPANARDGMTRFLNSVTSGANRGLACYQPTRPIATRSMTAEALVCRQFLGVPIGEGTMREAGDFLLQEPPGAGLTNHYYWYYATLAMYQMQGDGWRRWNGALQKSLLSSQRTDAGLAGSWDPDPVWGGCGGRIYSTALSTLCLEVYYRYLPLYVAAEKPAGRTQ